MSITDYIKDLIGVNFRRSIDTVKYEFLHTLNNGLRNIERRIMSVAIFLLFIIIGVVFLSIAGVFFFIEYFGVNNTISFLIIGIIFLLIGLIVKVMR